LNLNNARYELTAVKPDQYPAGNMPEVVLAGRSNVGKSSIINTLLNRKNLARVSSEPGKTRGINFYNIDDAFYLVDLPGYGYAKTSKGQKMSWGGMMENYLNQRPQLALVLLLVDIRHTPSKEDKIMFDWIEAHAAPHLVIASKMDKISRGQVAARLQDIRNTLGMAKDESVIPYSSETGYGKDEIWNRLSLINRE
jgi:GTP-binding protein